MAYTAPQRAEFVLWFVECNEEYAQFAIKVRREHGQRATIPQRNSIIAWKEKLLETGSLARSSVNRQRTARTETNIETAQQAVEQNPHISSRSLANQLGVSNYTAYQILVKDLELFPYKAQTAQELLPGDPEIRCQFARQMLAKRIETPNLTRNLFFLDEAHFHRDGVPNRQNFRTWSAENPNFIVEEPLHSERVTALVGIGYYGIIGPFFFDGNVNGERYLAMLRDRVVPALQRWPNFNDLILVQDGAPPHYSLNVRAYLNEIFEDRWIGRASPFLTWPPRSPDLTPMDFFVWGHLKDRLYKGQKFASLEVLKAKVDEEAQSITIGMVLKALKSFWNRMLLCEMRGGLHVETTD